jgi:tetratricopeptide (TPR) repeat protein
MQGLAFVAVVLLLAGGLVECSGAAGATPGLTAGQGEESGANTNNISQEVLRSYLQLQEQIHGTQLAIERNRKEVDAAEAQHAEALALRLQSIEKSLAAQRAQELEAMQNSNKAMLIVAGSFAGIGFVALLLMAVFQWRTVNRLADISANLPNVPRALLPERTVTAALGIGEAHPLAGSPVREKPSPRLLEVVEQLEKRIHELEHTTHVSMSQEPSNGNGSNAGHHHTDAAGEGAAQSGETTDPARIRLLLGKGQTFLNLDNAEEALACFEEVLAIDASHLEALVKKGSALERLRKPNEAIACYDRAIAADGSMTMAYLYKGGLCNRLERFSEALECYEKALHTQEKRRG